MIRAHEQKKRVKGRVAEDGSDVPEEQRFFTCDITLQATAVNNGLPDIDCTPSPVDFGRIGQGDVVREYVDAFRAKGLQPGLYYSIWDNTEGAGNTIPVTATQMAYIKTQLTELLSNYGPIPILVIDGWSWKTGHNAISYEEIRNLVKSLQPNCLLTDHTHLADPWDVDIANFEEPAGSFAPSTNTYAAQQETKINTTGGNDWFWAPDVGNLMSVSAIVDSHLKLLEPRWTNFIVNCPPNRDGLLDPRWSRVLPKWAPLGAPMPRAHHCRRSCP